MRAIWRGSLRIDTELSFLIFPSFIRRVMAHGWGGAGGTAATNYELEKLGSNYSQRLILSTPKNDLFGGKFLVESS
jgi:hypothetical protein